MRYRHFAYRYTMIVSNHEPQQVWRKGQLNIIAKSCWRPGADLYETRSTLYLTVELAGTDSEDVDILLYENALVIEGVRRLKPFKHEGVFHSAEIKQGPFKLEFLLPAPIDAERVEANYVHGLLRVKLPKVRPEKEGENHHGQ